MALWDGILKKGANTWSKIPTAGKIGAGVAGAGLVTMGAGAVVGGSADRKKAKAEKYERKAEAAEDASNNLVVAGAIATAGVSGAGIATLISKIK